ncbi:MAG: leishmanolysin-related zinc metalloendopeptidase [Deinococcales bacterium]
MEKSHLSRTLRWFVMGLIALLAACSSLDEVPARDLSNTQIDLSTPNHSTINLTADVSTSVSGSFSITNDQRRGIRYRVNESATWLAITSPTSGRLSGNESMQVDVMATCPATAQDLSTDVRIDDGRRDIEYVTVNLSCVDTGEPPPPPPPPSGSQFEITLVFNSTISESQKQVFRDAAARWAEAIIGDVADVNLNKYSNYCGQGEPSYSGMVDDVVIYASVEPIDGTGRILGSAGPCLVRSGSRLPVYGTMRFDSADVANLEASGNFDEVILHEMGHVLGIGTIWESLGMISYAPTTSSCRNTSNFSSDPVFLGSQAATEYQALGGSGYTPIENGGGAGTRCGHWDEETFNNELMTGYLDSGYNAMSRMTIASLADIGYGVNKDVADSYSIPGCSPACLNLSTQAMKIAEGEVVLMPMAEVDELGGLERFPLNFHQEPNHDLNHQH